MKTLITCFLFICLSLEGPAQTFTKAFLKVRQTEIDRSTPKNVASMLKKYNRSLAKELTVAFDQYKQEHGFDFNVADSVFLILISPAESPFFCHVIIWSGMDTISYQQEMQNNTRGKTVRGMKPTKPRAKIEVPSGYVIATELDSVMNLIQSRNLQILSNLGKGHSIMDGASYDIYLASKNSGVYQILAVHPDKFFIPVSYRKL